MKSPKTNDGYINIVAINDYPYNEKTIVSVHM